MAARTANALWEGSLQDGRGQMSLGSGAFEGAYSFKSRFGDEDTGTNPEELVAAAHAGCFTMALSLVLTEAGSPPESLQTQAKVTLRNVDGAPTITKIALTTRGRVPAWRTPTSRRPPRPRRRPASSRAPSPAWTRSRSRRRSTPSRGPGSPARAGRP